ncbi:cell wall metabolism sensor histidine kinase WalK [Actinoplanes sp. N902-109]|uniref:sensor histidine kinase n=1 Tax=Actinoplanes sp. (strain N902-109) TaxID=649831 RepID=UPI0003293527|nr:HAMP domain-containing sensor histidine kinase [Actinoplanes sp. N902-109]AGL16303.1 histidine kinase [Actinoplanes sp. N902-109]
MPFSRSLLARLLATSLLIALCAIAATAWLTMQLTKKAVTQEQSRTLSADTDIYDAFIEYAATHQNWDDVQTTTTRLAELTGTQIALSTPDREPIAAAPATALDAAVTSDVPTAQVDPLFLDSGITRGTGGRIDARAVGPYRLGAADRRTLQREAARYVACLGDARVAAQIVDTPSGRPVVRLLSAGPVTPTKCDALDRSVRPIGAEIEPLAELTRLVDACVGRSLTITPLFEVRYDRTPDAATEEQLANCVGDSRRKQMRRYVAPPALLFVTGRPVAAPPVDLSRTNQGKIAGTAAIVLVLTVIATFVVGLRLVRPLRALTEAAREPVDRQRPVPVTTRDEIGYLATAFNDLSARRAALEEQRKAMVSDIAHELRTPLTNIRTWLETARDGAVELNPEALDLLVDETIQLHHIIDDLRDIAAADAGNLRLHRESTYLRDLLDQVAEAHRGATTIEVVGDDELMAYIDPVRLRQIVGNLVSNALRHSAADGRVTLRAAAADGRLTIEVADTGTGMTPDEAAKVFDRFWRADTSRSRATGGSGLGLSIARQLARAHGGDISVTSSLGAGSTFTVDLPA